MSDVIITVMLLVFASFVYTLIAGARNRVVIYFDFMDYLISFMPWGSWIIGSLLYAIYSKENVDVSIMQYCVLGLSALSSLSFSVWSLKLSVFHNRSAPLGFFIGVVKILSALIGTLIITGRVMAIFDQKTHLANRIGAGIVIAICLYIGDLLINGERVYEAKGLSLPS